ncbi:MAG: GNAT family N-acetyltransferase [Pseudomonadota bacterium]
MSSENPTDIRVEVCRAHDASPDTLARWEALLPLAAEDNLNFAPTPFYALLEANGDDAASLALLWQGDTLVGVWPFRVRKAFNLPVRQLATYYDSSHMMSSVPLLHADHVDGAVEAFLSWVHRDADVDLFGFDEVTGKSGIAEAIDASAARLGYSVERYAAYERAVLERSTVSFETYLQQSTSGKRRNTLKRKRKKIQAFGTWTVRCFSPSSTAVDAGTTSVTATADWQTLLQDLIDVEARSWKAGHGSAIACNPGVKAFVTALCDYAASTGRLYLIAAYLDDKPVAAQLGLINDNEVMIYKLGYDDQFKAHSPGLLLTYDMICHAMQCEPRLGIDSCGDPAVRLYAETLQQRRAIWKARYGTPALRARLVHGGIRLARLGLHTARNWIDRDDGGPQRRDAA